MAAEHDPREHRPGLWLATDPPARLTMNRPARPATNPRFRFATGARLALVLALAVLPSAACDSPASPSDAPRVSESALEDHLEALASDALRGRRAGSSDERAAAEYVQERFVDYDLDPGPAGYFDAFPILRPVDGQSGLASQNVIGVLPGGGSLAGEWVVVGAHYDALGVREPVDGDAIYNGADDNASGTAVLLELARALQRELAERPASEDRRSLLFQAFGAEEVGLVGSRHFCQNPTVPLGQVVAMVNLDMVGRLRENTIVVIGSSSSADWPALVTRANTDPLSIVYFDDVLDRSDQWCFYQNGRPVLFLHTGLHEDYHTPSDEIATLNVPGMKRVGDLTLRVLRELIETPTPPRFGGGLLATAVDERGGR